MKNLKKIEENSEYEFIKAGYTCQFQYTPLYTNYEASSPREVPIGAKLQTFKIRKDLSFYDGMPISTDVFSGLISGFKSDDRYGRSEITEIDLIKQKNILDYIKKI